MSSRGPSEHSLTHERTELPICAGNRRPLRAFGAPRPRPRSGVWGRPSVEFLAGERSSSRMARFTQLVATSEAKARTSFELRPRKSRSPASRPRHPERARSSARPTRRD
jgi:hypothetical protein